MRIGINALPMAGHRSGIGNYTYNLINSLGLVDNQNQYRVYVSNQTVWKTGFTNLETVRVKLLSSGSGARILWEQLCWPAASLRSDLDLMHYPDYALPVLSSIPAVITVHDVSFHICPETFSRRKLFTKRLLSGPSLHKAHRIITDSENTKNDLLEYFRVPQEKVEVIPIGVDHRLFQPLSQEQAGEYCRKRLNLDIGYLLYLGTLEPRKNIVSLIRAFKLLKERYRLPQKLVIAGSKGWLFREIFRLTESLGLAGEIVFAGYVPEEDLPKLYSGAGVFVYPSIYEGFGLPPLEAMACGIPVVSSNVSSLPEVVGKAGLLVEPLDIEAIAEAIYQVLNSPGLAAELVLRGIERARQFTWEKTAGKTLAVYEQVYAETRKRR